MDIYGTDFEKGLFEKVFPTELVKYFEITDYYETIEFTKRKNNPIEQNS